MQLEQYYSDDYAGLVSGKYKFYYGYEVTNKISKSGNNDLESSLSNVMDDEDDSTWGTNNWCFQVKENGVEIFRASTLEIEKAIKDNNQLDDVKDYLLAGIGMWLLLK
jgi:hypothetical protein